ncbi:MAG: DUF4839 domain-containing protein, partial [Ilumatobacter sp.]|nr:DUF4839 domain-containing protein [Ilumatobacter sp.]
MAKVGPIEPTTALGSSLPTARGNQRRLRMFGLSTVAMLVVVAAGCGSGEDASSPAVVMPDVTGQQLDIALSDIERAGVDDDVEILGGGALGVVVESNWQVCEQLPAAGEEVAAAPRLTVDRECSNAEPATTEPATTEPPTTEPPTTEPETTEPEITFEEIEAWLNGEESEITAEEFEAWLEGQRSAEPLTIENNPEFAALMAGEVGDCTPEIGVFAKKYYNRKIEFDGNVADVAPHEDKNTRFDFLIYGDDY